MSENKKVHVATAKDDIEHIISGITSLGGNLVYFITLGESPETLSDLRESLKPLKIEVREKINEVDLTVSDIPSSLEKVLAALKNIFDVHREDEIYINISGTNSLISVALYYGYLQITKDLREKEEDFNIAPVHVDVEGETEEVSVLRLPDRLYDVDLGPREMWMLGLIKEKGNIEDYKWKQELPNYFDYLHSECGPCSDPLFEKKRKDEEDRVKLSEIKSKPEDIPKDLKKVSMKFFHGTLLHLLKKNLWEEDWQMELTEKAELEQYRYIKNAFNIKDPKAAKEYIMIIRKLNPAFEIPKSSPSDISKNPFITDNAESGKHTEYIFDIYKSPSLTYIRNSLLNLEADGWIKRNRSGKNVVSDFTTWGEKLFGVLYGGNKTDGNQHPSKKRKPD